MAAELNSIFAMGLSHHTAPVEVREQLAMDEQGIVDTLRRLRRDGVTQEALLLSTCNRMEVYAVGGQADLFASYLPRGRMAQKYMYVHRGLDAVRHMFRVASALDSLVLGEPQILGQVRDAVRVAEEAESLGRVLHPLTRRMLKVAKRVRTETDLARHRVGIGNAGVDLALQLFGRLEGKRALLLGVGEMGRQVSRALLGEGLDELVVCNRTHEGAVELASEHGWTAVPWSRLEEYLARVDIVVGATSASGAVLTRDMVARALRQRRYRPLFLIDLSVPRNIDPNVDRLDDAYLFNIDHLQAVVSQGQEAREEAAVSASALVDAEANRFATSLAEIQLGPTLGWVTQRSEAIRAAEMERSAKLLTELDDEQREALEKLTRSLVKKIMHGPLQSMRQAARDGDRSVLEALRDQWKD